MKVQSDKPIETLRSRMWGEMGSEMRQAMGDPAVVEVMLNPDGMVWVERQGEPPREIARMSAIDATQFLGTVAHSLGQVISPERPILEGSLLTDGSRIEACLPPVVAAPVFAIRKQATTVFTLDDYRESGALGARHLAVLRSAIEDRKNILVVGATASGKTTFANAILHWICRSRPSDRLVTLEDTHELQVASRNRVALFTSHAVSMRTLLRTTLRLRPDRIVVGEVRGGEALDLLKAWNTGHRGGVSTVHANSSLAGLLRLAQLCEEVVERPSMPLIAEAVDIVLFIRKTGAGRRVVNDLITVEGYRQTTNDFVVEPLDHEKKP